MDMPIDLYQSPPAIIWQQPTDNLERLLADAQKVQLNNSCNPSIMRKKEILKELMKPLQIEYFFDKDSGFYYGLMFETNKQKESPPFAVLVYFTNQDDQPTQLHKLIYPRQSGTLIILYKDSKDNFSIDGIINWTKPVNVECIRQDDGSNTFEIERVYERFKMDKFKKERRKDEGRVLPA